MLKEFKEFISRGNVLDMAVGIIVGSAFTAIVTSLVEDILTPLIGLILGGIDLAGKNVKVFDATISYGSFIQAIINFLLISLSVFFLVKAINILQRKKEKKPEEITTKKCPFCFTEIAIQATRCPNCTSELGAVVETVSEEKEEPIVEEA